MSDLKIVVLWTDALVFLLLAGTLAFGFYIRRKEHLIAPWRRLAQSRAGMAALVVLALFLGIGLVDSLHFRPLVSGGGNGSERSYAVEVLSLLDVLLAPLRERKEKTYSAPLAAHLFAKETIELPDGRQIREYPRLLHGGAHLRDPATERIPDIGMRTARGVAYGGGLWLLADVLVTLTLARRRRTTFSTMHRDVWRGVTGIPWNVILITVGVLLLVAGPVFSLAAEYHVLGTDKVGQDVLYLSLKSIRTALVIGTLTTLVTLPLALLLGIMAGYFGGRTDDVIQYLYTTLNSIPGVLLIAAAVLTTQVYMDTHADMFETVSHRADFRLLFLCIILGMTSWTGLCRLLRGEALKLREMDYIQAAQAFGVRRLRIITRHILPNVMHIVLIAIVMDFSGLVLAEAVLSYVGVGVDPSMISFGTMINGARLEMAREPMVWWSLAAAFVFMFLLVLAANLFADAVRDAFDPRVRVRARTTVDDTEGTVSPALAVEGAMR
ncbi:MAG: ABC transporter permease [Betaproteobacteria bacterium]|nr:ABC transporter permease [Betaproteobacteria bacterium]